MTGVVNVPFVAPLMAVPPVAEVYQRYSPLVPPVAVSVTAIDPHPVAPLTAGAEGTVLTVAVAGVRGLSHVPRSMLA